MRALTPLLILLAGCSTLGNVYVAPGYKAAAGDAVKRITVGGWAPSAEAGAAPIIARVAADFIKLRKNYLVPESVTLTRGWEDGCKEGREGVLAIRVLKSEIKGDDVGLTLATELYRCADGALLWRAEGSGDAKSNDEDLKSMVQNYATDVGPDANIYAAPAFIILQDVLNALPDVTLSDAEVEEKIELGAIPIYERVTQLAAGLTMI